MVNRFIYERHTQLVCKCHLLKNGRWSADSYMKGTISLCVNVIYQGKGDGKQSYI